jgi:hypothetical protein
MPPSGSELGCSSRIGARVQGLVRGERLPSRLPGPTPPPPACHGAAPPNPTCNMPRVEARFSCTSLAHPCLSGRRGGLVTRARRAATRRRSRSCTKSSARRPTHQRSCTSDHGSTAGPIPLPRTATAAPKSTGGSGAPSAAVRQFCGATASNQARIHDVAA